MFNILDVVWVEFRGMSVITAIFFTGCFGTIAAIFWWIRKEFDYVYTKISNHALALTTHNEELSQVKTQLAVIQTIVENTDNSVNRLDGSINRLSEKIYKKD